VRDYPGNYTQYRDWRDRNDEIERQKKLSEKSSVSVAPTDKNRNNSDIKPRRLTYKEQKELESLESEIENLEAEKNDLETRLASGNCVVSDIETYAKRLAVISSQVEEMTLRWMELSEIG